MLNVPAPQPIWDHEITSITEPAADWLWHGFLAGGNVTLLTGMWKSGKTTLLTLLLSRRRLGGTLAGLAVKPGKTVVVTEENALLWAERARRQDFGGSVCFFPQPFVHVPRPEEWQALIGRILQLHDEHRIDLAVLDPLAPLLRAENSPKNIFDTMLPLGVLTRRGMAVLVMHHPAKGERLPGQAARGSGALLGHVDISIEMRHPGGNPLTRRRRLLALSRHSETPRQMLIELDAEGSDYLPLADDYEDEFQANWNVLRMIFEEATHKLTRDAVLNDWPADFEKPSATTLRTWLTRAVDRSLLAADGTGRKSDPFRYWLPEMEAKWKDDPIYALFEQQERDRKLILGGADGQRLRKRTG